MTGKAFLQSASFFIVWMLAFQHPARSQALGPVAPALLPSESNAEAPATTFVYRMTCYPDSVRCDTSANGDTVFVTSLRLPSNVSNIGLIGYFPMDSVRYDLPGIVRDMSGFGNHGIFNGSIPAGSDRCGNPFGAYIFLADTNFVTVPHHPVWEQTDTISITCWFKKNNAIIQDANDADLEGLVVKAQRTGCTATPVYESRTFILSIKDPNQGMGSNPPFDIELNASNGFDCHAGVVHGVVSQDEWNHVAAILKPGTSELYFNGSLVAEWDLPSGPLKTPHDLFFGKPANHLTDALQRFFFGSLDDVILFNRALTPMEIAALYQACPAVATPTLCFGDSLVTPQATYKEAGFHIVRLLAADGCDSAWAHLTILPEKTGSVETTLCDNDTLQIGDTIIMDEVLNFPVVISNVGVFQCDSTVFVTRHNLPTIQVFRNDTLCREDTLFVNTHAYHHKNPSGTEVMTRFNGCDSVVVVDLTFREQALSFHHIRLCENSDTLFMGTLLTCGVDTLTWDLQNEGFWGCDSTVKVLVSCLPVFDLLLDTVLFHTDALQVVNSTYRFANAPVSSGIHRTLSGEGCDSTISVKIQWKIKQEEKYPEAITPNGDGINDAFVVPPLLNSPADFPNCRLVVLDRYGRTLFRSVTPYQNNWDGLDDAGQPLPAGTYIYIFYPDGKSSDGRKGNVTIIR